MGWQGDRGQVKGGIGQKEGRALSCPFENTLSVGWSHMAHQSEGKKQEEMASYSALVIAGFVIIIDGWLHPGSQIIVWSLRTCTSTVVLFFFIKTEGNSSFPGVLCAWVCWNHKIKIFKLCYFFVCFLTTKAALCVSSSLSPSIPNPQSALPPCHFLSHSARLVCIPGSTVLSIFNYNHTVQGFQALSWRAGTILITKLISKAAEKMPAQADICFATRSWVRVKIKQAAMFSHTSFVFSKIHLQSQTQFPFVGSEYRWWL